MSEDIKHTIVIKVNSKGEVYSVAATCPGEAVIVVEKADGLSEIKRGEVDHSPDEVRSLLVELAELKQTQEALGIKTARTAREYRNEVKAAGARLQGKTRKRFLPNW